MSRSYIRFVHKATISDKSTATSASGQRMPTWTDQSCTTKCYFVPNRTNVRVSPSQEQKDLVVFYFPHDASISYESRIHTVVDRFGGEVASGTFEVVGINKFTGYGGRTNHLQVRAALVTE